VVRVFSEGLPAAASERDIGASRLGERTIGVASTGEYITEVGAAMKSV